jgi:hypothetical protein
MVTGEATYTATYTESPRVYTVTFDSKGGSEVKAQEVEYGKKATEPAKPTWTDPSKTFDAWYAVGATAPFDFSTAVTADTTLEARWEDVKVTVTFMVDGEEYNKAEVKYNETAAMPDVPTKENEVFVGWFDGEEGFTAETKVTKNLEVTAKFEAAFTYSVDLVSKIGMRVNMMIPKDADPAEYSVRVQYNSKYQNIDKTIPFTDTENVYHNPLTDRYTFYPVYVGSDEMVDVAKLTILKNDVAVASKDLTVRSIAEERIATETDADIVTLMQALLQYGHYAQLAFHTHEDDLPPYGVPPLSLIPATPGTDPAGFATYFKATRFSLGLDEEVTINVTLTPADGYKPEDFDVVVTDKNSNPVSVNVTRSGGVIFFQITGIYSDQMSDDYNITLKLKNTNTSLTWTRSIIGCAYNNQQQGKVVDLMQALYQYALAAKKVFA